MNRHDKKSWIDRKIFKSAVLDSFMKLNPKAMVKNPVMFVVEVGFVISFLLVLFPNLVEKPEHHAGLYNGIVSVILFCTLHFANFAEAIAEGRGKAQAESMRKTRKDTMANLLDKNGKITVVPSSILKKGDLVYTQTGDTIPNDGEVVEGLAFVDESAITGESAPVMKEAGGDFSSVTGGTKIKSDWLKIRITATPGESFLDKMISLVEGASRQKTPNEIALTTVLVSLTMI